MKGYLSAVDSDRGRIPVESRTELYRDPDDGNAVVAETDGRVRPLGIADVTVSRKGSEAPVSIVPRSNCLEVRNNGNTNGVTLRTQAGEAEIAEGLVETVEHDATLVIGYQTELRLTVEREARVEQRVVHRGEGDVVVGDQTNVDRSTTVDDSVVNRSTVGEAGPDADGPVGAEDGGAGQSGRYCPDCGAELAANAAACPECGRRFGDGDADTKRFCPEHQRAYTGEYCPACRRE